MSRIKHVLRDIRTDSSYDPESKTFTGFPGNSAPCDCLSSPHLEAEANIMAAALGRDGGLGIAVDTVQMPVSDGMGEFTLVRDLPGNNHLVRYTFFNARQVFSAEEADLIVRLEAPGARGKYFFEAYLAFAPGCIF